MSKQTAWPAAPTHARLWLCADLPLWVRVSLYATEHHRRDLDPGELHRVLAPNVHRSVISRAIRRGIDAGALGPDSTARCLFTTNTRRASQ